MKPRTLIIGAEAHETEQHAYVWHTANQITVHFGVVN